jgi:hypothetical protein
MMVNDGFARAYAVSWGDGEKKTEDVERQSKSVSRNSEEKQLFSVQNHNDMQCRSVY